MGLDCSRPSRVYDELYLPADTFRLCNPRDRCWCDRGHGRREKYWYVERGGDGRERLHDPLDYMDRFVMGGGGWQMPWKDVQYWTTRDYDRLGEIMTEYNNRLRGRQMGWWGGGGGGPAMSPPWMNMMPAMMMADEMRSGSRSPRGFGRRGGMSPYDNRWSKMFNTIERQHEELEQIKDQLYGSEKEEREQAFRQKQMPMFAEILQAMMGMSALNNMGAQNGMYPNMGGMPMGGAMPQQFPGMGGMTPQQQQYAAAMGQNPMGMPGMMPGQYNPLAGGMGDPRLGGGLGGGIGRRSGLGRSRRRGLTLADELDDDDDMDDILRSSRSRRRRRGRGRWGADDLDDELGGLDGSNSPRPRPRPPPVRPSGGGGSTGGAGLAFDDTHVRTNRTMGRGPSPEIVTSTAPMVDPVMTSPIREASGAQSPSPGIPRRTAGPTAADQQRHEMFMPSGGMMPGYAQGVGGLMPGYPTFDGIGAFGSGGASRMPSPGAAPRMSGALGGFPAMGMGASGRANAGRLGRGVSFLDGNRLSRPRQDEENRGEPQAGGPSDSRRDAEPS